MKLARTTTIICAFFMAWAGACSSSSSSSDSTEKPGKPVQVNRNADPRERVLAPLIGQILEAEHLRARKLDDSVSEKAFAQYLKMLDPGKMFLLQKDVKQLEVHARRMDDEMKSGRLSLAHAGTTLLRSRIEVIEKLVAAQLKKGFDFNRDEYLETDDDKLAWASSESELADRWRKNLKLQVMAGARRMAETAAAIEKLEREKAAGKAPSEEDGELPIRREPIPKTVEGRLAKAAADLAKTYSARFARLRTPEPLGGASMFVNSITHIYDPHTAYLAPATKENFDIRMSGSLEGIGAVLVEDDHYIRIESLVPGGASWRQGDLEAGDLILSVAQFGKEPVDVIDMPINRVVKMIRGKTGTIVTLTVKKPDNRIKVIAITRDVVKIETAYAKGAVVKPKSGSKPMGYIYLPSFYGNTRQSLGQTPERRAGEDIRKLLVAMSRRKVEGVVLDLRGNGGGLLDDAREIAGLFIETGPIVQTRQPDGEIDILRDRDPAVVFKGQVVVLVDRGSASASEILAGALQDYKRAIIVGTGPTHGKGTVQVLLSLDRIKRQSGGDSLGVLKLTRQQFFRVTGDSTQRRGVIPDVLLPDPAAYVESGERRLEHSIPWSKVMAVSFEQWPKQPWTIPELVANSGKRQAAEKQFATLEERNKLLEARKKATRIPLQRDKWLARIQREKKELDAVTVDFSKGPERLDVQTVVYAKSTQPVAKARPGRRTGVGQNGRWKKSLARDPWVAEAVRVLQDMTKK